MSLMSAVLTAVTLVAAAYWKEADRLQFLRSNRSDGVPVYWLQAVEDLHDNREPLRIAITAGMLKEGCNQIFYHFLGARLQNRLCYITLTEDGHIVPQVPKYAHTALSFDAWRRRLIENKITHVIALKPESVEARWMTQAPEQFRPVVGDGTSANGEADEEFSRLVGPGVWGLFEVRAAAGQDPGTRQP